MADRRSKAQVKEPTAREMGQVLRSRIQMLDEKFDNKIDAIDKNFAQMLETTRTMTIGKGFQSKNGESSQARSTPSLATPTLSHNETMKMKNSAPFNYSGLTRSEKLSFPDFNGENVRAWLLEAEEFFSLDNTPEDQKVSTASFHFDGVAATWHRSEFSISVISNWNLYRQLLLERFGELSEEVEEDIAPISVNQMIVKGKHGERFGELSEEVEEDIAPISVNQMIVKGTHGKHDLYVLIATGSTYNFIDKKIAEKLGCQLETAGAARVRAADGQEVGITAKVKDFEWYFQGVCFKSDFMVVPLGGHDMMLGYQWLETLGPTTMNFKTMQMTFSVGNSQLTLRGIGKEPMTVVEAAKLRKLVGGGQVRLSSLYC